MRLTLNSLMLVVASVTWVRPELSISWKKTLVIGLNPALLLIGKLGRNNRPSLNYPGITTSFG